MRDLFKERVSEKTKVKIVARKPFGKGILENKFKTLAACKRWLNDWYPNEQKEYQIIEQTITTRVEERIIQ